jgi:hypothetical protein
LCLSRFEFFSEQFNMRLRRATENEKRVVVNHSKLTFSQGELRSSTVGAGYCSTEPVA